MNFEINENLIIWLKLIFREKMGLDFEIKHINSSQPSWSILVENTLEISCAFIPNLYKLGNQNNLPCSKISIENFEKIYFQDLISPGIKEAPKSLLERKGSHIHINYDFIGLIYWCLTRAEEIYPKNKLLDEHSRFKSKYSHAFVNGYLDRPVVDEWFYFIKFIIKQSLPRVSFSDNKYSIYVSHDVDSPSKYRFLRKRDLLKTFASTFIKQKKYSEAKNILEIYLSRDKILDKDPFNTFDWIMNISESKNIKSSFYFMTGISNKGFDSNYKINTNIINNLLKKIHQRGHLIGVHPSYYSYNKPLMIAKEGLYLKRICENLDIDQTRWGGRMHYLRWEHPTTAIGWEKSGYQYDSSLTFADNPGFRCGTCNEYQMYDPIKQRILNIREKPLIVMEVSLFHEKYLNLKSKESVINHILSLKNRVKSLDGQFTILWHNSNLDSKTMQEIYTSILDD